MPGNHCSTKWLRPRGITCCCHFPPAACGRLKRPLATGAISAKVKWKRFCQLRGIDRWMGVTPDFHSFRPSIGTCAIWCGCRIADLCADTTAGFKKPWPHCFTSVSAIFQQGNPAGTNLWVCLSSLENSTLKAIFIHHNYFHVKGHRNIQIIFAKKILK